MTNSRLCELAIRQLTEGRSSMARALSECAVKLNAQDIGALNVLGMTEFRRGNYARGIEILAGAMNLTDKETNQQISSNLKRCINDTTNYAINHLKKNEIAEYISALNSVITIEKYNWLPFFY